MAEVKWIKINDFAKWVKVDKECIANDGNWDQLRKYILERDNYTCVYCGNQDDYLEIDHILPRSRGGLDVESNLVCACRKCNRSKGDKTPEEWGWPFNGSL